MRILERFLRPARKVGEQKTNFRFSDYEPGTKIAGKYLIHKVLEGGLGRVFVVSENGAAPFVLKTIKPGADQAQFLSEARVWVGLGRHPNIVPAFWADNVAGMDCAAAEFIPADNEGRTTLRDHLGVTQPSLTQALRWSAQFLRRNGPCTQERTNCASRYQTRKSLDQPRRRSSDYGFRTFCVSNWGPRTRRRSLGNSVLYGPRTMARATPRLPNRRLFLRVGSLRNLLWATPVECHDPGRAEARVLSDRLP